MVALIASYIASYIAKLKFHHNNEFYMYKVKSQTYSISVDIFTDYICLCDTIMQSLTLVKRTLLIAMFLCN